MQSFEIQVDLEAPIEPTESVEKVKTAIKNIFPDAVFDSPKDGIIHAVGHDLTKLKERLAAQAIRDASRRILLRSVRPGHLYFIIAKQAAYVNRVSFSEDGPLGDITVIVRNETPEALVDHLTEKDEDQRPPGRMDGSRDRDKKACNDEYIGYLEG